jgi:hypothetical protein
MCIQDFMARISVKLDDSSAEELDLLNKGGDLLRALCQKEVESFDQYLRRWGSESSEGRDYSDGLVRWEKAVVEGYLYQKLLGRF